VLAKWKGELIDCSERTGLRLRSPLNNFFSWKKIHATLLVHMVLMGN